MNKPQKIVALTYAALIAASVVYAPHHADGTGDPIFRILGTKNPIPYSANAAEREVIEQIYTERLRDPKSPWHGSSLNQFSRQMDYFNKENPSPNDLDFTAGFSGWPVPNYTMLAGFWVVITIFGVVGLGAFRDSKNSSNGSSNES